MGWRVSNDPDQIVRMLGTDSGWDWAKEKIQKQNCRQGGCPPRSQSKKKKEKKKKNTHPTNQKKRKKTQPKQTPKTKKNTQKTPKPHKKKKKKKNHPPTKKKKNKHHPTQNHTKTNTTHQHHQKKKTQNTTKKQTNPPHKKKKTSSLDWGKKLKEGRIPAAGVQRVRGGKTKKLPPLKSGLDVMRGALVRGSAGRECHFKNGGKVIKATNETGMYRGTTIKKTQRGKNSKQ